MRGLIATALGLAVLALGCGAGFQSCSQLYDQFAVEYCQRAARCGAIGASEEMQCETDAQAGKKYAGLEPTDDAIVNKRTSLDSGIASNCLDQFRKADCANLTITDNCSAILKGLQSAGASCKEDFECANGYCDHAAAACSGTCKAYVATGAACAAGQCAASDFCDLAANKCTTRASVGASCVSATCQAGLFCRAGTCGGSSALGETCGPAANGSGNSCTAGLYCDPSVKTPVCKMRGSLGADCSGLAIGPCVDGLLCVLASGNTMGKCLNAIDVGGACDPAASACATDLVCDAKTRKCAKVTLGTPGSDCTTDAGCTPDLLAPPLFCDLTIMKCATRALLGQPCNPPRGNECFGSTCDTATKTCVASCM